MKTDHWFYGLFQSAPDLIALLMPASTHQILELRPDLLSTVFTVTFERFPKLSPEEIMVIAGIPTDQLLHTRAA